jgi:hypothetical protein
MYKSKALCFSACFAALALLANCTPKDNGSGGTGGQATSEGGSSGGAGGSAQNGGSSGAAGAPSSTGGAKATGGSTPGGSSNGGAGGSNPTGGTKATGGTSPGGGSNGGVGGSSAGGAGGVSAGGSPGGSSGDTTPGTGGTRADSSGIPLAKPGDSTTTTRSYLNLGDMRLINNRWGADARNCKDATYKIFVANDGSIGYDFNRPACGGDKGYPDYPEVEFGVAPFGTASKNLTSPPFSSTTLLPIQIKQLTSASVTIDNFNHNMQSSKYWDSNFEFWISKQNPLTSADAGVYAEIIMFLAWNSDRMTLPVGWPCDKNGSVTAGGNNYSLCHQSDSWSNGQWRFFNFNVDNGPKNPFSTKADVKAILDYIMNKFSGFTPDMWLTRIEVGTEIDDNTVGTATIKNLTFEINGTSKSIEVAK